MYEAPKEQNDLGNEELWGSTPKLDSLSEEDNKAIYDGDFASVISRISSVDDASKRDRLIQDLLSEIGTRQRELSSQREIAETEWKNPEKVTEYQASLDNLDTFQNQLLPLHDSAESPVNMADEISRQLENSKPVDFDASSGSKPSRLNKFGELE